MDAKIGIGFSSLTEKVYIGKKSKNGGKWIGNDKKDITSEFIGTMFQYVEPNTTRTIQSLDEVSIFMNVRLDDESINKAIVYLKKRLKNKKK